MKILITGSRGFLGGTIGRFAAVLGHEVLGTGRATQPDPRWPGEYFATDVQSADLSALIHEFTPAAIIHAAGTASVGASFASPLDDLRASLLSWANVLESVRRSGTSPLLLYPSSAAVYGQLKELPVSENAPLVPISPYGFHKAACELLGREFAVCFGQRLIVLRLFSVFGEAQRRLLIWELFHRFTGSEESVWLEGTGKETRDYLYADDMADAIIRLLERKLDVTEGSYQVINLASGREQNVLQVAEQMKTLLESKKKIYCHGTQRSGDPERWQADISHLKQVLGDWKPGPFEAGLARCLRAWQSQRPSDYDNQAKI